MFLEENDRICFLHLFAINEGGLVHTTLHSPMTLAILYIYIYIYIYIYMYIYINIYTPYNSPFSNDISHLIYIYIHINIYIYILYIYIYILNLHFYNSSYMFTPGSFTGKFNFCRNLFFLYFDVHRSTTPERLLIAIHPKS